MPPPNEEALVHEVIEDSSESETAAGPRPSPCRIWFYRIVGLVILLVYVLSGVVLPNIGLSTYLSAESAHLEKEFSLPGWPLVLLYILFVLAGGLSAWYAIAYPWDC
jgi:ABC-type phosphate/phosphonate transport system permease subunit